MDLLNAYNLVKRLLEKVKNEDSFSSESVSLINILFKDFDWSGKENEISLLGLSKKRTSVKELSFRFKNSFAEISNNYQISIFSIKYWNIFLRKIFSFIGKVKL